MRIRLQPPIAGRNLAQGRLVGCPMTTPGLESSALREWERIAAGPVAALLHVAPPAAPRRAVDALSGRSRHRDHRFGPPAGGLRGDGTQREQGVTPLRPG